jgi:hypothetical protein
MSNRKTIFIRTDGTGAYTWERNFQAVILGIEVQLGDLSTPDIDITDDTYSTSFLSVDGLAADAAYFPGNWLEADTGSPLEDNSTQMAGPAVCMGVLKVVVTGGGDTKRGRIVILYN